MRNLRGAFTLLEIMVVLAILGFGMGLIMEMTAASARHSERVEEDTIVQLACENMMNSILAGEATATVGISTPIPDAPNWETTIELLDGPIDKLIAIRISAQRYETQEVPSIEDPSVPIVTRVPDVGRLYVIKEWARRAEIKTRVVRTNSVGEMTATDGTGETVMNDMNLTDGALGGGDIPDPFAAIDQANGLGQNFGSDPFAAPNLNSGGSSVGLGGGLGNGANAGSGGLGGGLNDASSGYGGYGGGFNGAQDGYGGFGPSGFNGGF